MELKGKYYVYNIYVDYMIFIYEYDTDYIDIVYICLKDEDSQSFFKLFNIELDWKGVVPTQQTQPLTQCWVNAVPSVVDGGPTSSQHWLNVSCLLGFE